MPYDLLGVGFGPASLSLAIAIAEHNSAPSSHPPASKTYSALGGLQTATGYDPRGRGRQGGDDRRDAARDRSLRVAFVEQHASFKWHPGMLIPGSTMQISFLKDLATTRNPSSSYTFLSYLHAHSRLLSFISLATFTPSRREFADYMTWAARRVQQDLQVSGGSINYGETVLSISHVKADDESAVKLVRVTSRNNATGEILERLARNLIISTGGAPRLPMELQVPDMLASGRILHSSQYLTRIDRVLDDVVARSPASGRPIRIAVLGGGQSSTEIFLDLRTRIAECAQRGASPLVRRPQVELFLRRMALIATEESQFANEVFDPGMSQAVFGLSPAARETVLRDSMSTNYSVVNPATLSTLYETMYLQKIENDITSRDGEEIIADPLLTIHPYSRLSGVSPDPSSDSAGIVLTFINTLTGTSQDVAVDAVVSGTGYSRQGWKALLFPDTCIKSNTSTGLAEIFPTARPSSPASDSSSLPTLALPVHLFTDTKASNRSLSRDSSDYQPTTAPSSPPSRQSFSPNASSRNPPFEIKENYRLDLPSTCEIEGAEIDFEPTVWLQGSNERTHGVSDSLLSVLAIRSGEILEGILTEGAQ